MVMFTAGGILAEEVEGAHDFLEGLGVFQLEGKAALGGEGIVGEPQLQKLGLIWLGWVCQSLHPCQELEQICIPHLHMHFEMVSQ